jgi:hypothetical protein
VGAGSAATPPRTSTAPRHEVRGERRGEEGAARLHRREGEVGDATDLEGGRGGEVGEAPDLEGGRSEGGGGGVREKEDAATGREGGGGA